MTAVIAAFSVRALKDADRPAWIAMRRQLFRDATPEQHETETATIVAADAAACFGAERDNRLIGFIEMSTRSYAEGCATSPVAYIEALWVAEPERRSGVARALIAAGAAWARDHGYRELASDAQLDNHGSQAMHVRLGFQETERNVCYLMKL